MTRPLAIITETLDRACADWLADHADVVWSSHDKPDDLRTHLARADALIVRTYTRVDAALLDQAPR